MARKEMARKKTLTERTAIGQPGGLRLVIDWRDDYGTAGPVGRTWGDLQLWIEDTLVWGSLDGDGCSQGIRWSWVELLEFLGNAWCYLVEQEQYPIVFDRESGVPRHPGELRVREKLRWRMLTEEQVEREDGLLNDFLSVHDLAQALQGAYPPSLILLRQGNRMLAATKRHCWDLPFLPTMATLSAFAASTLVRLEGLTDRRSKLVRKRWHERDALPLIDRLSIATGQDADRLHAVLPPDLEWDAANDDLYEIKAAARMTGDFPADQAKAILAKIAAVARGAPLDLGDLGEAAAEIEREHASELPATQGYLLATLLREHFGLPRGRIDPEAILNTWGVAMRGIEIPGAGIDAIAVWGCTRHATVFVNTLGPRAQLPTGKRSTLAHEICHLLIDRHGALPAVEVLGGKVPARIEQRANAFAAELLLPRAEIGACLRDALRFVHQRDARDNEIEAAVARLAAEYEASHEIAAWQALRCGCLEPDDEPTLKPKLKSVYRPF